MYRIFFLGFHHKAINRSLLTALLVMLSFPSFASAKQDYLAQLQQRAEQLQLDKRIEWHKLMFYKPDWRPGHYTSQVDASQFFLAADGKTNPAAELRATLAAFFEPLAEDEEQQQRHAQCRFIARYHWLKQELNFDSQKLTEQPCPRFDAWYKALNPAGITLIFPSAYINSPASMFGHTLMRVDSKDQTEETKLLSYSINFAANTGDDGALIYAFKGLLGGYPGAFSVLPYYLKVREYTDLENRDVWEYQLKLTPEEVDRILWHAWEMRDIWFRYYFFNENCSYHLLSMIETARPELRLTDQFGVWAIPSDTVRVVADAGLVGDIVYRPSRHAQLEYRLEHVPQQEVKLANELADGKSLEPVTHLAMAEQAEVLDIAHEIVAYNEPKNEAKQHKLLQARSEIKVATPDYHVPPPLRPELGHPTGRISLAAGREAGKAIQELDLRPAYHDLLDPSPGYGQCAKIEFFDLQFRHSESEGSEVKSFKPVVITSITPWDEISRPTSWSFEFGLIRKQGQPHRGMIATVNGGAGASMRASRHSMLYALLQGEAAASDDELDKGYAIGLGPSVGWVAEPTQNWALHLYGGASQYVAGDKHHESAVGVEQRLSLNKTNTLRLDWSRRQQLADPYFNFMLSWQVYL